MSTPSPARARRRNPAPLILAVVAVLLLGYYAVVYLTGALQTSTNVPISGDNIATSADYLTLQMKSEDIDLTNKVIGASVLPIPHGTLVGARAGEMSKSLRIEITSASLTTSVVTFPGKSIVDPTSINLVLDRGDTFYPFDRPFATFQITVIDDESGDNIPFVLTMENSARPWVLSGAAAAPILSEDKLVQPITLTGSRDALSVILVLFYVLAILLTTLMAVVTIGTALIKRKLEFSNVIWLSATMLSFPALRSAMPGAPPIGTGLDYVVFFPCICLIAAMLVWTGAHLLWRESATLRRRHLSEDEAAAAAAQELEVVDA